MAEDYTAGWVHGNAVVAQSPESITTPNSFGHYGVGTQIVIKQGVSFWFHIPLPTPAIVDGVPMRLIRAFIQLGIEGPGRLDHLHLWDGDHRRAIETDFKDPPDVKIPGCRTFEFYAPLPIQFGVGLSFMLTAFRADKGIDTSRGPKATFVIGSAGAHFERTSGLRPGYRDFWHG